MNHEGAKKVRVALSKRHRPTNEWLLPLGAVQQTLNLSYRERMGITPFQFMTGPPPAVFGEEAGEELGMLYEERQAYLLVGRENRKIYGLRVYES